MATSNFIDTATIWLHAGKGGDGAVTFHREKFVAAGGPDGGDGGRGGDIIFVADDNLSTLMDFRYKRKYTAADGENGRAKRQSGADADDLVIRVPRGTVPSAAETGLVVADLPVPSRWWSPAAAAAAGATAILPPHPPDPQVCQARPARRGYAPAAGAEGHRGCGPDRASPMWASPPSSVSSISAARPKIANYHFTTLTPVLGAWCASARSAELCLRRYSRPDRRRCRGRWPGPLHFLRHVERCRLLLHVVDVSGCEGRDPKADFEQINHELAGFSATGRPPADRAGQQVRHCHPEQGWRSSRTISRLRV